MDGTKQVLVQLGSHNRVVAVQDSVSGSLLEREALISSTRITFSDKIEGDDTITLQLKDEDWGGVFVDYYQDKVPDKSMFRVIVEKPQVSNSICAILCRVLIFLIQGQGGWRGSFVSLCSV